MILNYSQIREIILNNPQRQLVADGVKYNKLLRQHLYGVKKEELLGKIDGFETQSLADLKVKYARSNKDLFTRLERPIDKVFSARGGAVYLNLPDELEKKARFLAQDVRNGYSVRKWVEHFWKPHLLDDPFGILFMEILSQKEAILAKQEGRSFVYPTYKAITAIFDYLPSGSRLEYVVFTTTKSERISWGYKADQHIYRVVDDSFDYLVERRDNDIVILDAVKNYFGAVPAMMNSDMVDPSDESKYLSFFDGVIELAQHFLMKGAIKLTHEFMHAYPKYWQYAESCPTCDGSGASANTDNGKCPACYGTGKKIMLNVSDAMLLEMPETTGDVTIAPHVAGYISPDKTYYEIATQDLYTLEELMQVTLWGAQSTTGVQGPQVDKKGFAQTATQVMNEVKPQADRLQVVSEMAEKRHKFIMDAVVRMNLGLPNYTGSSVTYGRRYLVEGPDDIWKKYSDARVAGASTGVLEDLLIEYYEAKYTSDTLALAVAIKLMYVEPFVHNTAAEVKGLGVSEQRWKEKLYYSEWLKLQSEGTILASTVEELIKSLSAYAAGEGVEVPQLPDGKKQLA